MSSQDAPVATEPAPKKKGMFGWIVITAILTWIVFRGWRA